MVAEKHSGPPSPRGLGKAGVALWRRMTGQFQFHEGELQILRQIAATVDEIDAMERVLAETGPMIPGSRGQLRLNPLYNQLAVHRTMVDRLMLSLGLPADGEQVGKRRSPQAKQAANARWRSPARRGRIGSVPAQQGGA
jgi:hypothetical protein